MPDLSTRYLGLTLKNPIVPSSTPLTRDGDAALYERYLERKRAATTDPE